MNVIKNLFLPEKIGSYYIFPKHIVGFDINKHVVHAAYVYVQGKKITIKDCLEELIEPGTQESYSARVSAAVTRILNNIPKYDAVHSSMSSSVAIFKTLVLPFTTYEKIKMVVAYEIEPSLPFALKDAVIDFVITKVDKENNQSEVLVVAVQKQYI
ncbi:pilus assembly protein PilM, partial [Candidatus Dependentiae bacterium]|nr:pilus assembly protein PilM [Candidatus Dependentiae bacterium]